MEAWTAYIWIGVTVVLFYVLIYRPQKKKEKRDRMLRNSLEPGDQIVTIGGFTGKILSVKDDVIVFETGADRTKLTIKKWAIQTKESPAKEDKPEGKKEDKAELSEKSDS